MIRGIVALIWAGAVGCAANAQLGGVAGAGPSEERQAVLETLQAYLSVVDERDADGVGRAFHPTGLLMSVSPSGALRFVTQDEWWERVSRIPEDAPPRDSRIVLIDVSGLAAVARIDIANARSGETTTDYFNLQRVDEGWRIVNKTLSAPIGPARRPRGAN